MKNKTSQYISLIFITLLIFSTSNSVSAQKGRKDVVSLKNGTILFGSIVLIDSVKGVRINNDCGSFLFQMAEIENMSAFQKNSEIRQKDKGYFNHTAVGLSFGEGDNGYLPFPSLTMVNGYKFNQHISAGLGFGFEFFDFAILPVFAQGYYYFNERDMSPFISLKAGYSFPLDRTNDDSYNSDGKNFGGIAVNPEIGIRIHLNEYSSFLCSIGYHYQKLSYENNGWDYWYGTNYYSRFYAHHNRISLRLGFIFR